MDRRFEIIAQVLYLLISIKYNVITFLSSSSESSDELFTCPSLTAHQCHQCLALIWLYCPILVFRVLDLTNATRDCASGRGIRYRPFRRQLQ
mgnify:CR=1 FL=1